MFVLSSQELPNSTGDLSSMEPLAHADGRQGSWGSTFDQGPVLVTVEYTGYSRTEAEFMQAINEYGRIRRRDGAYRWGLFRDTEISGSLCRDIPGEFMGRTSAPARTPDTIGRRRWNNVYGRSVAREPKVHHLIYAYSRET